MPTVRFQLRRDTAANWTSVNPTLGPGEPALETDTGKVKYGNGAAAWNSLPYFVGDLGTILTAIHALTPAANRYVYFTSASAAALGTITAFGRSLLDDTDAVTARGTLELGSIATQAASSVAITGGSAVLDSLAVSGTSGITNERYSSTAANGGALITLRARGTISSPSAVLSGDVLGGMYAGGWRTSTNSFSGNSAAVYFTATEDFTSTYGTNYTIATTAVGSTSRVARTTVDETGLVQNGIVRPSTDNARTLGSASFRWSVVYAGTGTINTSDQRLKKWRGGLSDAELRAGKRIIAELGFYQWKDAIKEKGAVNARFHFGVRAQRVFAIIEDEGLDWRRYAWCCYDEWDALPAVKHPEMKSVEVKRRDGTVATVERPTGKQIIFQPARRKGSRYGVRMDQLALFLIAVQEARLARLEALASVE